MGRRRFGWLGYLSCIVRWFRLSGRTVCSDMRNVCCGVGPPCGPIDVNLALDTPGPSVVSHQNRNLSDSCALVSSRSRSIPTQPDAELDGGLVDGVMRAVNDHIRGHSLKPGAPIPAEAAFSTELGVSRAVVREAFRSLTTLGVIEVTNGRRARVGGIDKSVLGLVIDHAVHTDQVSIQQIYDVRRTIEMRTVALASLRRKPAEADEIDSHAAAMRANFATPRLVMEHDIAFHEAISRASRNPLFALMVSSFGIVTQQTWGIGWASRPSDQDRMASVGCHERIATAIRNQDVKAAESVMAEHFDLSVRTLLAAGVI